MLTGIVPPDLQLVNSAGAENFASELSKGLLLIRGCEFDGYRGVYRDPFDCAQGKLRRRGLHPSYKSAVRKRTLQLLARDALHFVHDPQQVAAPEFFDLFFGVVAADEF